MIYSHDIRRVHFELSSRCNAKCPNCPRNVEGGYTVPTLLETAITLEQFKKILPPNFIKQLHLFIFCGNYGDPIFCTDLPAIAEYVYEHNKDCRINMHTNGGARNTSWWSKLAEANPNLECTFSVDGLRDTNHIYRRGVVWEKVMSNAESFINNGGKAIWEYLLFQHNQHQVNDAKDLAVRMGFKRYITKRAFGFEFYDNHYKSMRVVDKNGDIEYLIFEATDENSKHQVWNKQSTDRGNYSLPSTVWNSMVKNHYRDHDEIYLQEIASQPDKPTCIDCHSFREKEIYIDASGHIFPCCWLGHSSQVSQPAIDQVQFKKWLERNIGMKSINALQRPIEEIINSDYFKLIEDTWSLTDQQGKLQTCYTMCNKNQNILDNLYKKKEELV